jgi:hypothetical protein
MVHGSASAAGMPAGAVKNDVINKVDIGSQEYPCEPVGGNHFNRGTNCPPLTASTQFIIFFILFVNLTFGS